MTLFSIPFDETAVGLLASLNAPAYKLASFEIIDLPLVARVARERKPMIISTGMSNLGEIGEAVRTARDNGCDEITDCRRAWVALGRVGYDLKGSERGSLMFRRSIYVVRDVRKGDVLSAENIGSIRSTSATRSTIGRFRSCSGR